MTPVQRNACRLIVLVALSACLGDPMGPGGMRVSVDEFGSDSVLVGAPGEAMSDIGIHVTDAAGTPIPGASVQWKVLGRDARALATTTVTDSEGGARTGWVLGTDAGELQELTATVLLSGRESRTAIHARAVPRVVTQLRVALDTPAVLRLGDTLPLHVNAIDPYGNEFPAPDVAVSLGDSGIGAVSGASVIGAGRGHSNVHVVSHGIAAEFPLHVTQYVASIVPLSDSIWFSAIGAELPVAYTVRDDRGRVVADTTAAIGVVDTTKVLVTGTQVRSLARGTTSLTLALGSAAATIGVGVQQRLASLALVRDSIHFDALLDTLRIRPVARDSLNADIVRPGLTYQVSDARVAKFVSGRTLTAVAPGTTVMTVRDSVTGLSVSAEVVVRQSVATIEFADAQIQFTAVGDTLSIGAAMPRDRLGSVVAGVSLEYSINDSAVAALEPGRRVKSVGRGQTQLTVRDPESGVTGQAVVVVNQVATALTVVVDAGRPIVTLPAGATLPLSCEAFDKNGFPMLQQPALVRSVKGTVIGSGCADVRVQRSGYDTLVFGLGAAQVRVPVIVSTRPDSVGIVAAAQPLTDVESIRFVGENLANPSILALRPLVQEILAAYGNPTTNLGRARAIRDWVARTAIHPSEFLHTYGSTSNSSVLPPGKTWSEVNVAAQAQWDGDLLYWTSLSSDGYVMFDRLLGTLDRATGLRANDGLMIHVGGAHYRMRDIKSYRYVLCTFQSVLATTLWAAAGLHGMILQTLGHDPSAVFIPELGKWVYEDVTFNDDYLLDGTGDPLSPVELLSLGTAGISSRARITKLSGPSYDPEVYVDVSYRTVYPEGFVIMGSRLYRINRPNPTVWDGRFGQIDVPALTGTPFDYPIRVTGAQAFPTLGVIVENVRVEDSVFVVQLGSTFPSHQRFERRVQGGAWQPVTALDILPVGACRIEYRSVDAIGNLSANATFDLWVPRTQEFLQAGNPTGMRQQARLCV